MSPSRHYRRVRGARKVVDLEDGSFFNFSNPTQNPKELRFSLHKKKTTKVLKLYFAEYAYNTDHFTGVPEVRQLVCPIRKTSFADSPLALEILKFHIKQFLSFGLILA